MRKMLELASFDPAWAAETAITALTIHYELLESGALGRLLENRDQIGLISCHEQLGRLLQARYNIANVEFIKIPGEQIHGDALGGEAIEGDHWPTRYEEVLGIISGKQWRGMLVLVAAGMLGKVYCKRLFELGAIVVDIGAVADILMGKNTREIPPSFKELALNSDQDGILGAP